MSDKLNILWVNDNPQTAHTMVFMYATNALIYEWWKEVDVIIWGPSAKLVSEDEGVQEKIKMAQFKGVKVKACLSCANLFGVTEKLESLGIEVIRMGEPLTKLIKADEKLITI